jgi:hypothetical protein
MNENPQMKIEEIITARVAGTINNSQDQKGNVGVIGSVMFIETLGYY